MNIYTLSLMISSLSSLALGLFVIFKNPRAQVSRSWGAACLCCMVWTFSFLMMLRAKDFSEALFYAKSLNVAACFMMSFIAWFCASITGESGRKVIISSFISCLLVLIFTFSDSFCTVRPFLGFNFYLLQRPFYHLTTLHVVGLILYTEYLLFKELLFAGLDSAKSNQIKYIATALTIGYLGGLVTFLPVYNIPIKPFALHFLWLYAPIITYAIYKHNLMDIKIVFKRTIFYSVFVFSISIVSVLAIFMIQRLLAGELDAGIFLLNRSNFKFIYPIPPIIGALVFLMLTLLVLKSRPRSNPRLLFSLLCFVTFFWQVVWLGTFFMTDLSQIEFLAKFVYLGITFLPVIFFHFIMSYFKRLDSYGSVYFYYSAALMLILLLPTPYYVAGNRQFEWGHFSRPGPLFILFVIMALSSMVHGLLIVRQELRKSARDHRRHNQNRYLFAGLCLYFFCSLDFLQIYGLKTYPVGTFFFIASFLVVAYAISRHSLLDIDFVIKKTAIYTGVVVFISLIYLGIILLSYLLFSQFKTRSLATDILLIFLVAIAFKPLEVFVYRKLEKAFFKGSIGEIAEQKDRLQIELERRERLKSVGILAAGMAHEIKNPLTAISTFTDYLPQKYDDPEFRDKFVRIVQGETKRIQTIVKDLLLFSKPQPALIRVCSANKIVDDILKLLSGEFSKYGIDLQQSCDSDDQVLVDGDQLKQALLNIFLNAIDAMRDRGGRLTVSTKRQEGNLEISIQDTGCGIPPDKIAHIFDPFFTGKNDGTGLGLSITHSIIEQNHGKIQVLSEVGKGAIFLIELRRP